MILNTLHLQYSPLETSKDWENTSLLIFSFILCSNLYHFLISSFHMPEDIYCHYPLFLLLVTRFLWCFDRFRTASELGTHMTVKQQIMYSNIEGFSYLVSISPKAMEYFASADCHCTLGRCFHSAMHKYISVLSTQS